MKTEAELKIFLEENLKSIKNFIKSSKEFLQQIKCEITTNEQKNVQILEKQTKLEQDT